MKYLYKLAQFNLKGDLGLSILKTQSQKKNSIKLKVFYKSSIW